MSSTTTLRSVSHSVEIRILPILLIGEILMQIDRSNISFASVYLEKDIGLTAELFGLAAGIFFVGYAVFELPSNLILQKVSANRWLGGLLIAWALVTLVQAFITSPGLLVGVRFVLGVLEGGFLPGVIYTVTRWLPRESRTRASGVVNSAAPLGAIVGGPLAGWLLSIPLAGLANWQGLFLVEGIATVVYGIIFMIALPRGPEHARWLDPERKAVLLDALARDREAQRDAKHDKRAFVAAIANRSVWVYAVAYLLLSMGYYGIQFWLPQIIKGAFASLDSLQIGLLSAVPFVVAIVLIVIVTQSVQRTGDRRWHLVIFGGVAALGLILSLALGNPIVGFVALCIAVACALSYIPVFWSSPMTMLSTAAAAGGIAIINSVGNLGGFVGPYIAGVLTTQTGGFVAPIAFFAIALAAMGAMPLIFRRQFTAPRELTSGPAAAEAEALGAAAAPAVKSEI